tara:strand:- start:1216 stop:2877 length:1662 start_codon:yes stop_codon:yes gene_type:complete
MIKILDCTLRDGGFYTQWDFDTSFVQAYCKAMDNAGVDYLELGYRSFVKNEFSGAYRYTSEHTLEQIPTLNHSKIAVMLDSKEFTSDPTSVRRLFLPAAQSRVSMVRVATKFKDLPTAIALVREAKAMGYETTINQMAWATLSPQEQDEAVKLIQTAEIDAFYIADSFGGMYPQDIHAGADKLDGKIPMDWGVHLHNNLELAFANAMTALDRNAVYVDSSVFGMGRGPGNLRTEIILQYLEKKRENPQYAMGPVIDFISQHMVELKDKYKWGPDAPYVLSGALSVHPTYAQKLMGTGRYSVQEVAAILQTIERQGGGAGFNNEKLGFAISERFDDKSSNNNLESQDFVGVLNAIDAQEEVLIVGRGPSVQKHLDAVNTYIQMKNPIVIECNHVPNIARTSRHYSAFVLYTNAVEMVEQALKDGRKVMLGFYPGNDVLPLVASNPEAVRVCPYRVKEGALAYSNGCVIPHDVVSMYAITQALRAGARTFKVVGFDGYEDSTDKRGERLQAEMNAFLQLISQCDDDIAIQSLLASSYDIDQTSVYHQLFFGGDEQ